MKRKVIISVLAVVLVLAMALGLFVACNPEDTPETKWTVTFKDGDTVVKTVADVADGYKLVATDMPSNPSSDWFEGWYVGSTKVEVGYEVKGNVTVVAKYGEAGMFVPSRQGRYEADEYGDYNYVVISKNGIVCCIMGDEYEISDIEKVDDNTYTFDIEFYEDYVVGYKLEIGEDGVITCGEANDWELAKTYTKALVVADDECMVTFHDENNEKSKSVVIKKGASLATDDIPSDPVKAGYQFNGWVDSADAPVDLETATFDENTSVFPVMNQTHYIVRFYVENDSDGKDPVGDPVLFEGYEEGQSKVTKVTAPNAPSVTDKDFAGWMMSGDDGKDVLVDLSKDLTIDGVLELTAVYASASDYVGVWEYVEIDNMTGVPTNGYSISITANDTVYNFKGFGKNYQMTYADGKMSSTGANSVSVVRIAYKLYVDDKYYDANAEEYVTDNYVLDMNNGFNMFEGTYVCEKNNDKKIVVDEWGNVTFFNSSKANYVYCAIGNGYDAEWNSIVYIASKSSMSATLTVDVLTDDNGVLVYHGDCYVKVDDIDKVSVNRYTLSDDGTYYYLREYVIEGDEGNTTRYYLTISADGGSHYEAYVTGNLDNGEMVTISWDNYEQSITAIVNKGSGWTHELVGPGSEKGTYTLDDSDDLVLDGFGGGKLGETDIEYVVNAKGIVVVGSNGYSIDGDEGTYAVETADGYAGKYVRKSDEVSVENWVELDGFGGATYKYGTSAPSKASYSIESGKIKGTGSFYGTYAVEGSGNVLLKEGYSPATYIKEGYSLPDNSAAFVGTWNQEGGDEVVTISSTLGVKIGSNNTVTATKNWDGSELTVSLNGGKVNGGSVYTLTISGGKLVLSGNNYGAWDDYDDDFAATPVNNTYTAGAGSTPSTDAFAGTWSNGTVTLTINGDGTGTFNNGTAFNLTYTVASETVANINAFSLWDNGSTMTLTDSTHMALYLYDSGFDNTANVNLTKQA